MPRPSPSPNPNPNRNPNPNPNLNPSPNPSPNPNPNPNQACRAPCQWSVLVSAYAHDATVTLLATVQGSVAQASLTTLQQGVALRARAPHGQYTFFRFDVATVDASAEVALTLTPTPTLNPHPNSNLNPNPNPNQVALTVFSGDPDLYASFTTARPTAANHSFASAGGGDEVVRISHLDPHYCAALPCTLYIGVLGYTNATFSVLASLRDDHVLRLVDGQAQSDALEP